MPRPRSLTPPQLAAAALAVTDRAGLGGLAMRTVAAELGVSTMGLYRYVNGREELERLVVDHVFDGVDTTPPPPELGWQEQVTMLVSRVRVAFDAHPAAVALTLAHRHQSPGALRWAETLLGLLTDAGLAGRQRVIAVRAVFSYLVGAIQLEHVGPLAGSGTRTLAELPPGDFPHTTANARQAREITPDEEFAAGLALLLRGLTAG